MNASNKTSFERSVFRYAPMVIALASLLPKAHAVVPPPDGGYPGFNTAEGTNALKNLTTGAGNAAVGWYSLFSNTIGSANTAVGAGALLSNTSEISHNTATGAVALLLNTDGYSNTANGAFALMHNTTGHQNTAIGHSAGYQLTTGDRNVFLGLTAGYNVTTGDSNVLLGHDAGSNVTTANNVICIGMQLPGANVSDSCYIGNIYGVTTQSGFTAPVIVSNTGQLGTVASSERFKKDIVTMEEASEAILSLRPVTFHYKSDAREIPQFGLIAEEVGKVNPALVLPDKDGKPYTVRYDAVNAMLLNEFLKEHKQVQEQQATISKLQLTVAKQQANAARQQTQIDALTSGLQKVSAEVQMAKPAPQVALNNP